MMAASRSAGTGPVGERERDQGDPGPPAAERLAGHAQAPVRDGDGIQDLDACLTPLRTTGIRWPLHRHYARAMYSGQQPGEPPLGGRRLARDHLRCEEITVPVSFRMLAATAVAAAAMTVPFSGAVATAAAHAGAAPRPGLTAAPVTLASDTTLAGGYDAATTAAGATYIAWIGDTGTGRIVHLCVLRAGATACSGGVQSTPSLGASSAAAMHVILTPGGKVTLVWSHDTVKSGSGPENSKIATAAVQNGVLSTAHDQEPAPSFGTLMDAAPGPSGSIWTVSQPPGAESLQVTPGFGGKQVNLATPYMPGSAQLAFSGSTAVLAIQQAGAITQPISYASEQGGKWTALKQLANTWTGPANLGLAQTTSGVRALASVDNSDYSPVVSRWTGSSFSPPELTGDKGSCAPSSHDPVADAQRPDGRHLQRVRGRGGGEPDRHPARGRRPVPQRGDDRRRRAATRHGAARPRLGGLGHRGQHRW